MSRCFPFPPPGYERQHRPEDLDLLKEAKSKEKEKKHKKEKKDKERKKDKEKKKDGKTEKHRDKKDKKEKRKDKKEKHRDKKKDKEDRSKDKEKSSISEESTVARNEEISEPKLYPVGNSQDRTNFPNEAKCSALLQDQNGAKPSQSSFPSQRNEESRFVHELDRRIRDDKNRGSQLPERVAFGDKKDPSGDTIRNSSGLLAEERGDNKNKRVDKKLDPQGPKIEFSGNTMDQNLMPIVKNKSEGIPKPVNEENGRRLVDKEKYKDTVGVKRRDKQKDKSKESHGKEKDKEKEKEKKKKDDKAKLKTENMKSEQDKLKDDGRVNNLGGFAGNKSTELLKGAHSNAVNEGNIKKRKDMGTNGFLHESEIRPNKMQRPAPHQSTENGRKLEPPFQTPAKSSYDKHAAPNSVGVDSKDQLMINGTFEAQKPSPPKPINAPPAATMVIDQIAESSKLPQFDSNDCKKPLKTVSKMDQPIAETSSRKRHPHPDSKYLAEVLTVPTNVANWSENDDQDWLFSEKIHSKPNLKPFGEEMCVWSEAVHIESVDVCALPYVIPY